MSELGDLGNPYPMDIVKKKSSELRNEVNEAKEGIMSTEQYLGSTVFSFDSMLKDDFSYNNNFINSSTLNTATNLLEAVKQSSQMTSGAINELTNAMNTISNVIGRGNLSTDNLGFNVTNVIEQLAKQTAFGNRINALKTELDSVHQEHQTEKNLKQSEHMDFEKEGSPHLKDSNNQQIKPRETKALNNSEQHIEQHRANTTPLNAMLDSLNNQQNDNESDTDISSDVISAITNLFEFDPSKIKNSQLEENEQKPS